MIISPTPLKKTESLTAQLNKINAEKEKEGKKARPSMTVNDFKIQSMAADKANADE